MDSLICYSDGKKRGYFNMFTGKPVIEPKYSHAWIFSDGLALVDDGGWIKFIGASGKGGDDHRFLISPGKAMYSTKTAALSTMDVVIVSGCWTSRASGCCSQNISPSNLPGTSGLSITEGKALDGTLNTVIPFTKGQIWVSSEYISVTLSNHIIQRYDHSGEIINDFYINDVSYMTYESDEVALLYL